MKKYKLHPLTLGVILATSLPALADHQLDSLVVTAPQSSGVLTVETDPKAPRQPIPAQDGADLLKNIPGFAVTRKGGTDGDPLFRGMAASRLNILMDGESVLGGCGNRMDPPTAYIFPEAYDNVTILKGPQSVKHGPGSSAGVVNFERATPEFYDQPIHGYVSALAGSFGRNDQVGQIQAGGQKGYVELKGMRSESRDYKDGNGTKIHSNYNRWSSNAALGWTPNADTKLELTAALADGEAAYGDRGMDGSKFKRENLGINYTQDNVSTYITQVKARAYRNYVDHVMDNFSLRTPPQTTTGMGSMIMGGPSAMNPDRETIGSAVSGVITLDEHSSFDIGMDYQQDQHSNRMSMNSRDYKSKVRTDDMKSQNIGVFTEFHHHFAGDHGLHFGIRFDHNQAEDQRHDFETYGEKDKQWLTSGFARYEHQLSEYDRAYIGVGHSQRAPDYWERTRTPDGGGHHGGGGMHPSSSTFDVDAEKLTQLDIGIMHNSANVQASLSGFYGYHNDYILIEKYGMNGNRARNINATTFGGEADVVWRFAHNWSTLTAVSYVHGKNRSDDRALGQIPAPELRLGLNFDNGQWTAGALWRGVAHQHRVAIDQGNVVGLDIGESSGYGVFSLNAGYRMGQNLLITAGLDNLFDRAYAEHISRSSATIPGYDPVTGRINELGRNVWLKAQYTF